MSENAQNQAEIAETEISESEMESVSGGTANILLMPLVTIFIDPSVVTGTTEA